MIHDPWHIVMCQESTHIQYCVASSFGFSEFAVGMISAFVVGVISAWGTKIIICMKLIKYHQKLAIVNSYSSGIWNL